MCKYKFVYFHYYLIYFLKNLLLIKILFKISQGRMFAAPFFHVGFADFWLADQFNSFVGALLDFEFLVCFYVTNGNWLEAGGKFINS